MPTYMLIDLGTENCINIFGSMWSIARQTDFSIRNIKIRNLLNRIVRNVSIFRDVSFRGKILRSITDEYKKVSQNAEVRKK